MEAFTELAGGFATALTPTNLAFALLGVLLGTAIGVLPGIGPAMAVALLLPLTRGLDVRRGGRGEPESGEDVELTGGSDWRTIAMLAAAFVANALLIEPLGWVFSGAILFWGSAFALGSRHYVRDAVIAFTLSIGSFYLFALGLGIVLPPGVLRGIL